MQKIEYKLFEKDIGVCIFKLPNLSTSKGFYLDDWKDMIWEGGIQVFDSNNQQIVKFVDFQNNMQEYARFTVPKNYEDAVQKTKDSARGYAMRLQNPQGGFLWIGVVFRDRNDGFNFNLVVSEYQEQKDRELNPNKYQNEIKVQDFTLKEKIVFTEHGAKTVQNTGQSKHYSDLNSFKFGDPNQNNNGGNSDNNFGQNKQNNNNFGSSNFNDFSNFNNQNQQQPVQQKNLNDFSDFSNFGNSNTNNWGNSNQTNNNFNNNNNWGNNNNNQNNQNQNKQQSQQQQQQSENLLDL